MDEPGSLYDIEVQTLTGETHLLREHAGKVLLIVNTASECGYTGQYAGLQALHERFGPQGLVVLGFPCNQFGHQEPGSPAQIGAFCQKNYGVTFPLHAKVEVKGPGAHPLFERLTKAKPGLLGTETIKWNFTKFLVDRVGRVVARHAPHTEPADLTAEIEALLAAG